MTRRYGWVLGVLLAFGAAGPGFAQDKGGAGKSEKDAPKAVMQAEVASKTAKFGTVAKSDPAYTKALDAKELDAAAKAVGKPGAFKGKVDRVFEGKKGDVVILNFAKDYKTALVAVLRKENFKKFPDMKSLAGKEVLVSGTFVDYQGRPELVLSAPAQVRVVE